MRGKLLITVLAIGILVWHVGSAYAATSDNIDVTLTIAAGTSMVDITNGADIAFGEVNPLPDDHRFVATTAMNVIYFAANDAWQVRCYTDNASGDAGLIGANGAALVLKLWNVNRGPGATVPDPEVDTNWTGADPYWSYIDDKDGTPAVLCESGGSELDPNGFDNYLAIDAQGAKAQAYSATLYVDIINL